MLNVVSSGCRRRSNFVVRTPWQKSRRVGLKVFTTGPASLLRIGLGRDSPLVFFCVGEQLVEFRNQLSEFSLIVLFLNALAEPFHPLALLVHTRALPWESALSIGRGS